MLGGVAFNDPAAVEPLDLLQPGVEMVVLTEGVVVEEVDLLRGDLKAACTLDEPEDDSLRKGGLKEGVFWTEEPGTLT